MYNLILAKTVVTNAFSQSELTTAGQVGLSHINSKGARVRTSEDTKGAFDLILGRPDIKGGPVILPLHTHALKVTIGDYIAPVVFGATIEFEDIDDMGDVTVVLTKKGVPFNERGTWTVNFPVVKAMKAATIAEKVKDMINANTSAHGLVATASGAVVTLAGVEKGVDYTVQATDLASEATITVTSTMTSGYGTLEQLKHIAGMAAADAGFEYTYVDGATLLYPEYPLNPLKGEDSEDEGYTIVTIRCGEPRAAKTHDEVVHQVVFVAFATSDKDAAATLVEELEKVGGVVVSEQRAATSSSN